MLLDQQKMYKESLKELEKAELLLDIKGDAFKINFVYQMLSEISQKVVLNGQESSHPDGTSDQIIYINGKASLSEKVEKDFYEA